MTEKIYDSKDEAMAEAERIKELSETILVMECYAGSIVLRLHWASDRDVVFRFRYKTAPKAGTRGYGWVSNKKPGNCPVYVASGHYDLRDGYGVYSSSGSITYMQNFEPIEPYLDIETALGRIVDWMGEGREERVACKNIDCHDCFTDDEKETESEPECRPARIANLLRIARGEG